MSEDYGVDTGGVQGRKPRATAANFQTHLQLSVLSQIIFFVFRQKFYIIDLAFIAEDKMPLFVNSNIWYDKLWSELARVIGCSD